MIPVLAKIVASYCGYTLVYERGVLVDVKFPHYYNILWAEDGEVVSVPCLTT